MSIAEKLTTAAENVAKVYDAGKKAEYDAFWDSFQSNGNRTNYHTAFARTNWKNGTTYAPKYPITCNGNNTASNMFSSSAVTDTVVPITISGNNASVFYGASLVTVNKLILGSGITQMSDWFDQCTKLKNIEIEGDIPVSIKFAQSTKLTARSITSIVEHLSDTATGKSVTFSQTAVNNADWSETEYESWDALVATRPNWTFALS